MPVAAASPGAQSSSSSSSSARRHLATGKGRMAPCRATLDDPDIAPLVAKMLEERTPQPRRLEERAMLMAAFKAIDAVNKHDPREMEYQGELKPARLLYSHWLTDTVRRMDPTGPDELFLLARGKTVEGWKLADIKRDDYAPNTQGTKQWQQDRQVWQANRLKAIVLEVGYSESSAKLVEDVVLSRNLPDPRDVRLYDLAGPLGATNFRLLELVRLIQVLRDGEALVFMEQTFPRALGAMGVEKVLNEVARELAGVSRGCLSQILAMPWTPVQQKVVAKALPPPLRESGTLRVVEGVAAASLHPGDWRYAGFDYE